MQALERSGDEREAWLEEACRGNSELLQGVRRLLWEEEQDGDFLRAPITVLLQAQPSAAPTAPVQQDLCEGRIIECFVLRRFLARGGMGQVWLAEDTQLRREVALKFVLPERVDEHSLALFSREARAGGRVQHENLVRTLAHGVNGELAWIAQELVPGSRTLRNVLDELQAMEAIPEDHYRDAAGLVASIADGLQAAHAAGVIHRDIKPQNILITRGGVPKVTDFGLARICDDSYRSRSGVIAGTFAYMSPEQASMKPGAIDERTDVFSLGIVLYELLTLRPPFQGDTTHQIVRGVLYEDPPLASELRSYCPRELALIAGKALEKNPERRYQSMAALANDLRRHLRGEPVQASPAGPWRRLVKFSRRRPGQAAALSIGATTLVVVSGLLFRLWQETGAIQAQAQRAAIDEKAAQQSEVLALRLEVENTELERVAVERAFELGSLSAVSELEDLVQEAEGLWPIDPGLLSGYESWQARADSLLAGRGPDDGGETDGLQPLPSLERHQQRLRELAHLSVPETNPARLELAERHPRLLDLRVAREKLAEAPVALQESLHERILQLEVLVGERQIPDGDLAWWFRQLLEFVDAVQGLHDLERGLAGDTIAAPFGWGAARRMRLARTLRERTVDCAEAQMGWEAAIHAIEQSDLYGSLHLPIQLGLFPLGPDPDSNLWEFAHVLSGEPPVRGEGGQLVMSPETGIVLVLIPGGRFQMGTQGNAPGTPNYDPYSTASEHPVHGVQLSPYFLSKYELTQGQWLRLTGENPSNFGDNQWQSDWSRSSQGGSRLHPVEQIDWGDCMRVLPRFGLQLPSEAQWEYGCRAGTSTTYWSGDDVADLEGVANILDSYAHSIGGERWSPFEDIDDGSLYHNVVGSYRANAFGLHDTHGNVWEHVLDGYSPAGYRDSPLLDPVHAWKSATQRVLRGGGFSTWKDRSGSGNRRVSPSEFREATVGVRPARAIDP